MRITEWRKGLWTGSRPTPRLYRWLKGGMPQAQLLLRSTQGLRQGPADFFAEINKYWTEVMAPQDRNQEDLHRWLDDHPGEGWQPATEEQIRLLVSAAHSIPGQKAAGLDTWPPMALHTMSAGFAACRVSMLVSGLRILKGYEPTFVLRLRRDARRPRTIALSRFCPHSTVCGAGGGYYNCHRRSVRVSTRRYVRA